MYYNNDMLNIFQMNNGEKLYHYTTIDALINIVKNKEFWITKWDYLNDIEELKVAEEVCETILTEEKVNLESIHAIKSKLREILYEDIPYFILSFSCDHDNQLLWSNFAHFDGINLEIDFAKFERELDHIIRWHGLVNYNLDSQKECLRKTFYKELLYVEDFGKIKSLKEINALTGEKYEMIITHIAIICTLYSMFFKRNHFNGENEYRFVFCNLSADYINFRIRKDLIVPYIEKKVKDIDFITKITLGPTNKSDMAVNGIRELLHHYNKDIDVVRSKIQLRF